MSEDALRTVQYTLIDLTDWVVIYDGDTLFEEDHSVSAQRLAYFHKQRHPIDPPYFVTVVDGEGTELDHYVSTHGGLQGVAREDALNLVARSTPTIDEEDA